MYNVKAAIAGNILTLTVDLTEVYSCTDGVRIVPLDDAYQYLGETVTIEGGTKPVYRCRGRNYVGSGILDVEGVPTELRTMYQDVALIPDSGRNP